MDERDHQNLVIVSPTIERLTKHQLTVKIAKRLSTWCHTSAMARVPGTIQRHVKCLECVLRWIAQTMLWNDRYALQRTRV
jgi:hypothetical protein